MSLAFPSLRIARRALHLARTDWLFGFPARDDDFIGHLPRKEKDLEQDKEDRHDIYNTVQEDGE